MATVSSDPYEQKLFQMFKSCDANSCGRLDEAALRQLCCLLELRDKGAVLIAGLAADGGKPLVSFEQFKEALLNFLGTELDGTTTATTEVQETSGKLSSYKQHAHICGNAGAVDGEQTVELDYRAERSLVISDEVADADASNDSPPESSDREVSPKLIVGSKKYGRRSRPQTLPTDDCSLSDSANELDGGGGSGAEHKSALSSPVHRSSSQIDIPDNRHRPQFFNGGCTLKRCASLPAQRNLQTQRVRNANTKAHRSSQTTQMSGSLQQQHKQALSSSVESLELPTYMETLSARSIVDIWERANVPNSKGILLVLGFDEDEINLVQLHRVLEEEMRGLEDEPQQTLMRASLALQAAELTSLRQTYRQLRDENAKLRIDNKNANRRVAMMAVEIDERHASLEDNTKKEIQMLEQRHSGVVRDLTARMAKDREHWTQLIARLEARIKDYEQDEIRMRTELELVRKENGDLESEQQKTQKQITQLLEQNIQLNREIGDLVDGANGAERSYDERRKHADDEADEVLRLVEKIGALQLENTSLRDKNDELVAEIENLNLELMRSKKSNKKSTAPVVVMQEASDEDAEQATGATATKRRGDSPSKTRITEESPRLGKLRKCVKDANGAAGDNSDTSGEWMALNSELQRSEETASRATNAIMTSVEELAALKRRIVELEEQLKTGKTSPHGEVSGVVGLDERCKELEASLEQMQRAYEDCEDYWQNKLSEERQLFEKERQLYEDEQQESDKKFTELMEKVREYEEQFSKDGRLSPIEEKDVLEQQYAELEAEAEELRESARLIVAEKSLEIETLQHEVEDLRQRLGESVEILTGACELSNVAAATSTPQNTAGANTQSPASSPISYLWHQSTIHEPAKQYQLTQSSPNSMSSSRSGKQKVSNNLSTSETAIFSTPVETTIASSVTSISSSHSSHTVSPIQKPKGFKMKLPSEGDAADCETSSTASGKSLTSTHSAEHQHPTMTKDNSNISPSAIKEELKRLKFFEISLQEQIKDLSLQRDGLVMELQQLQEARPVLEKAYARTAHPTLIQRVNQLELRNRHLQNAIKQQQQYTETLMQQTWHQHQVELTDLHGRIEAQGIVIAEQTQRLQNADVLVKDLYVENSHLTATIQHLEQQRARIQLMQQHHQQQQQPPQRHGLSGLPGMP